MEVLSLLNPRPRGAALVRAGAGILLLVSIGAAWQAFEYYQSAESISTRMRELQSRRKPVVQPRPSRADAEIQRHWNSLRAEQSFQWYRVFHALEAANNPDIELLEFVPDKAARRIVLRGEARNLEALTAYLGALAEQSAFNDLHLAHQKMVHRSGMDLLTFEIRSVITD